MVICFSVLPKKSFMTGCVSMIELSHRQRSLHASDTSNSLKCMGINGMAPDENKKCKIVLFFERLFL